MKPILTTPTILMGLLAAVCLFFLLIVLKKVLPRTGWAPTRQKKVFNWTLLGIVGWVTFIGVFSAKGAFSDFNAFPPRPLVLVFMPILFAIMLAFSTGFKVLLSVVPPHWLVLFQSFRIFVELLLWRAFAQGLLPVQMTFEGRNFDIIAGALALVTGWLMVRYKSGAKKFAVIYNIIGMGLLLNIMIVSILSMPTPMQVFTNEPANTLVTTFPFVYLPTVLVVLAFAFHVFSLRQFMLKGVGKTSAGNHAVTKSALVVE